MGPHVIVERDPDEILQTNTLGTVRLRHVETKEIILIPTPSRDPNDPLNWSKPYRIYLAMLVCMAMLVCNFLAAGPTVAIVDITVEFMGVPPTDPGFVAAISKVSYFFTTTALLQGISNLIWMPLIIKYGRRPLYIISFSGYFAVTLWAGFAHSFASELVARILLGAFSGTAEAMAPVSISDLFFLHERGFYMAMYTASLSAGVSAGIIISGLITTGLSWRYIYFIASAIIGVLLILVVFTFPETAYNRDPAGVASAFQEPSKLYANDHTSDRLDKATEAMQLEHAASGKLDHNVNVTVNDSTPSIPRKNTFIENLKPFHGTYVKESIWKMFYRPVVLLVVPAIFWATLVMSVTIGFLVAISSNFATAFATTYGFAAWQSGLCFISGFLFTMLGIFGGGVVSDWVADYFTKRNNGIREPEMRLPAVTIGLICSPLGLILYGVGIEKQLHWIVPTLGLGFLSFAIAQATNVTLVYVIDSYRPIAGETVVTQLGFKSCFGFLLSFYTNPWIAKSGYLAGFGEMAAISFFVLLMWIPMYIWGGRLRHATMKWRIVSNLIKWSEDREVGE